MPFYKPSVYYDLKGPAVQQQQHVVSKEVSTNGQEVAITQSNPPSQQLQHQQNQPYYQQANQASYGQAQAAFEQQLAGQKQELAEIQQQEARARETAEQQQILRQYYTYQQPQQQGYGAYAPSEYASSGVYGTSLNPSQPIRRVPSDLNVRTAVPQRTASNYSTTQSQKVQIPPHQLAQSVAAPQQFARGFPSGRSPTKNLRAEEPSMYADQGLAGIRAPRAEQPNLNSNYNYNPNANQFFNPAGAETSQYYDVPNLSYAYTSQEKAYIENNRNRALQSSRSQLRIAPQSALSLDDVRTALEDEGSTFNGQQVEGRAFLLPSQL